MSDSVEPFLVSLVCCGIIIADALPLVIAVVDVSETAFERLYVCYVLAHDVLLYLLHSLCRGEQTEQVGPVAGAVGITIHAQSLLVILYSVLQGRSRDDEALAFVFFCVVALFVLHVHKALQSCLCSLYYVRREPVIGYKRFA